MDRREIIKSAGLAALLSVAAVRNAATAAAAEQEPASLDDILKPYLAKYDLPALAAAVVRDGTIVAAGAVGTRRVGTDIPVGINDRFHYRLRHQGDDRAARGDAGRRGQTALGYAGRGNLPRLAGRWSPQVGSIRLDQLLSHSSGIPGDNDAQDKLVMDSYRQTELNLDEMRYWMSNGSSRCRCNRRPASALPTRIWGTVLAGAIAERLYGSTREQLVATRIFDPLGLKVAGFGPPGDARPYRRAARASADCRTAL